MNFGNIEAMNFQTNNFSLSFWVKGVNGLASGIIAKDIWAGTGDGLLIYKQVNSYRYWTGTTAIIIGPECEDWCHIAVTRRGTGANEVDVYLMGL